jgi:hypothetical protein
LGEEIEEEEEGCLVIGLSLTSCIYYYYGLGICYFGLYCLKPRPILAHSWLIPATVADAGHSCRSSSSRLADVSNLVPSTPLNYLAATNSNEFPVTILVSVANQRINSSFHIELP